MLKYFSYISFLISDSNQWNILVKWIAYSFCCKNIYFDFFISTRIWCLVGGWALPLWNKIVSWDDYSIYIYIWKNKKKMFQTTNQKPWLKFKYAQFHLRCPIQVPLRPLERCTNGPLELIIPCPGSAQNLYRSSPCIPSGQRHGSAYLGCPS